MSSSITIGALVDLIMWSEKIVFFDLDNCVEVEKANYSAIVKSISVKYDNGRMYYVLKFTNKR